MKKILLYTLLLIGVAFTFNSCSTDSNDLPSRPATQGGGSGSGGTTGKGGSYARFAIVNDYMYVLHDNQLLVYSLSDLTKPKRVREINMRNGGRDVETIFSYENHLLFGTTNSMLVYSLTNPEEPQFISQFSHAVACDPVVAQNGYAYVTLNGSTGCRGRINQLDILDISNLHQPRLRNSVSMTSPRGLGIDGNTLFVCDGDKLQVFDVNNPTVPYLINSLDIERAYDVIPHNNNLILSAAEGIYQYDYTDPLNLKLNSLIKVEK